MGIREQLLAVTPLDGRDGDKVNDLRGMVSEFGLMKYRLQVEVGWLSVLNSGVLPDVPAVGDRTHQRLRRLGSDFSIKDGARVKEIEATTNHDVNALVKWLTEQVGELPVLKNRAELTHLGLTSEDLTNLAYAMMMRDVRDNVLLPKMEEIREDLEAKAKDFADISMLAHTHGQPASPTTVGKEMVVFAERLQDGMTNLGSVAIKGKLNGATGNYNALTFAYPEVDWPTVSRQFVGSLGFEFNRATTQIEPHDWMARYFHELALNNTIMTDIDQDIWAYIMLKYFSLKVNEDETGSSTMPHKVNPIDYEKSEGNLGSANAVLYHLARTLPISRLQRHLSDSTVQRTIGEGMGHTLVGHITLQKGLGKIRPNEKSLNRDLEENWAVLTEAVQTVMRRYGIKGAYEAIKAVSRGKDITEADYLKLAAKIDDLPPEERHRLLDLTPSTYIGRAPEIARGEI